MSRCTYCFAPMPVAQVEFAHECPEFDGEVRSVRVSHGRPASVGLLVSLAEAIARTFPSDASTWGNEARAALVAAREDGLCV